MSTPDIIKESIAPLVQRILSDPLQFKSAKQPDIITHKPSSYIRIGQTSSRGSQDNNKDIDTSHKSSIQDKKSEEEMARTRPKSLAQAIAGYTGKRLSDDTTNKRGKKLRKLNKDKEAVEDINDEDLGEDLETITTSSEDQEVEDEEEDDEEAQDSESADGEDKQEQRPTPYIAQPQAATIGQSANGSDNEEESSSSDDDTNYTDAEESDFVSVTPRNIISAKVFKKYQQEKSSSGEDSEASKAESSDELPKLNGAVRSEDEDEDDEEDDDYKEEDAQEEEEEEEEEEDEDYVDASAHSDEAEESSAAEDEDEAEEASDDESSGKEDEAALIKKDLLSEKSEAAANANTPPTSPESEEESDDAKTKTTTTLDIHDFYGIEESPADRGSNDSSRIIKNWGAQFSSRKPLGLLNHGVTCYTNAAVQAMIHIPAVQHYLCDVLQNKYKDTINSRSVTNVLAETSARMWGLEKIDNKKGGLKFINPKKLIGRLEDINCMMSEWQQEDSHEYFMSLLSRLQEDSTPRGKKLNESIIYDIFGGSLDQFVTCKSCGHISKTQQEFYDLSLHLGNSKKNNPTGTEETNQSSELQQQASDESKHRYSINKSIKDFFSPELIKTDRSDKSGYVCEKCDKRTNAMKISTINRAPETLAVHLKRFRFNGNSSSKVKQGVSYPLILDLSQYTTNSEPVIYQLISVVVHEGRSVSSGHYVAHCRQPDGVWATYDDEYINIIPEKQVLRDPSAYYLIYTRLTHKDIKQSNKPIMKPALSKNPSFNNKAQHSPSSSKRLSSPSTSTPSSKAKSFRAGKIIAPSGPLPASLSNIKKQKFKGLKPTNNLGNITGKSNKRYNSKDHRGGSKRFKKYS